MQFFTSFHFIKIRDMISKLTFIRKIQRIQGGIKKNFKSTKLTAPAILVNSFPKSGTHLLKQVFEPLGFDDYLQHPSSLPSFPHKVREVERDIKDINNIVNNELICAHFFSREKLTSCLSKLNIIHFFIYRDLRDVVLSEMFYLKSINKLHALHSVFKNLENDNQRIKFAIMGNDYIQTKYPYPNISERFAWYKDWITDAFCYDIRFEDLINNDTQHEQVTMIINHLKSRGVKIDNINKYIAMSLDNLQPKNSHTYRKGGRGNWKTYFNKEHRDLFKEYAGNLLIELNYESDSNW